MKKYLLAVLASAGICSIAHAGIIYWQVNNNNVNASYADYTYAKISFATEQSGLGKTYLDSQIYAAEDSTAYGQLDKIDFANGVIGYADFGNSTAGYFAVELFNGQHAAIAHSILSYKDVESYIKASDKLNTNWSAVNGGAFSHVTWSAGAVPEPTSGLLLLMGAALLGLRRKRA